MQQGKHATLAHWFLHIATTGTLYIVQTGTLYI